MSQGLVERQNLEDIADAIRSKNGSSDTYTPAEMAQAISEIQTADEVVLVQKTVNSNGQYNASDDSADGYSGVRVNVPNSYSASDEGKVVSNGTLVAQTSKNIIANGTHDTTANNSVVVDVPNSYAAADEGKVVSGGALVGQTSRNVTVNGTYDTTTNNEVIVNVSGGGGGGEYSLSLAEYLQFYGTSPGQIIGLPYTVSSDYEIEVDFEVTETSSNNSVIGNSNKYDKPHLTIYNNKWYTSTGGNDLNFGNSSMLTGRHTAVINKNGNSVLFDEQVVLSNLSNNSYQNVYLWVGGRYSSSPGYTLAKAKIYEYKITSISTGNVICDLKPAEIKKNNNVVIIGLYDVINDVFYTSSGTTVSGTLIQKTITQNGTYNASDDNADGYSSVTVNVSGGGGSYQVADAFLNGRLRMIINFGNNAYGSYLQTDSQYVEKFLKYYARDIFGSTKGRSNEYGVIAQEVAITQSDLQGTFEAFVAKFPVLSSAEYYGYVYDQTQILSDIGAVLLGDFSQGGNSTGNALSDSIDNYSAVLLQGIYNKNRTNQYNTSMIYVLPELNTAYWTGMKDRNNSYDCNVTFTDNSTVSLSGNKQVIIYGIP